MGYDDQDDSGIPKKSSDCCKVDSGLNTREYTAFSAKETLRLSTVNIVAAAAGAYPGRGTSCTW
jgi:hypothetical protein